MKNLTVKAKRKLAATARKEISHLDDLQNNLSWTIVVLIVLTLFALFFAPIAILLSGLGLLACFYKIGLIPDQIEEEEDYIKGLGC